MQRTFRCIFAGALRGKSWCQYENPCANPESFVRGCPTLTTFFFKSILLYKRAIIGPPAKRHLTKYPQNRRCTSPMCEQSLWKVYRNQTPLRISDGKMPSSTPPQIYQMCTRCTYSHYYNRNLIWRTVSRLVD